MDRVVVKRDIVYKQDADLQFAMNVYVPASTPREMRLPAIMFIHGGPIPTDMPPPTTWGIFQSYGELAAASGFAGVTFNHRLHGMTDYGKSQSDIVAAIDYVRDHADAFNVNADCIGYWVFSGAGPQLSWVLRERPDYIRAAAAFYALLDARHSMPPNSSAEMIALAAALSPVTYLQRQPNDLPLFVARAGLDSEMINKGIDSFLAQAVAANACIEFMNHPQGHHAFDGLDNNDRSREIISRAISFFNEHLT
jgi:acetyl esterase/lipase